MSEPQTVYAKYVYLDVVDYSKDRTVEAQTQITDTLNQLVKGALLNLLVDPHDVIYIPTGDGICVTLVNVLDPYDLHVDLALEVLKLVYDDGGGQTDSMRKFNIRVAVNENIDNLITDINHNRNVAGPGINLAQRILNLGDGGNILVGRAVFERLAQREKYHKRFRGYTATVKHAQRIAVYQLVDETIPHLNSSVPTLFRPAPKPKFTKLVAYYVAFLAKYRAFIASLDLSGQGTYAILTHMASRAEDAVTNSEKTNVSHDWYRLPKLAPAATVSDYHAYYMEAPFGILADYSEMFSELHLGSYSGYFEGFGDYLFVTKEAVEKLIREWPTIAQELEVPAPS